MLQSYGKLRVHCKFFSKKIVFLAFLPQNSQILWDIPVLRLYLYAKSGKIRQKNNTYKRHKQWRIKTILKRTNCKLSLLRK